MNPRPVAFGLLALCAVSCKKSKSTDDDPQWVDVTVNGRAYEADGNTPLAGKTVSLTWAPMTFYEPGSPVPDPSGNPLATATTSSDGRYSVILRLDARQNTYNHQITVALPIDTLQQAHRAGWLYFPKAFYSIPTSTQRSLALATGYTIDLPVYRRTQLTLHSQQLQPGAWNSFNALYGHPAPDAFGFVGDFAFNWSGGTPGATTVVVPTLANRKTYINWTAHMQDGSMRQGIDSVYCSATGTNAYTINW